MNTALKQVRHRYGVDFCEELGDRAKLELPISSRNNLVVGSAKTAHPARGEFIKNWQTLFLVCQLLIVVWATDVHGERPLVRWVARIVDARLVNEADFSSMSIEEILRHQGLMAVRLNAVEG